ncbi:ABC transporter substrate-binding protein [Actinomadura sp. NBRC 104425]|uniref:endolytic transglycosylase MltG n=1 Tax=Actinomadura sp. NBRC 104425 TaxID=3032204 RepID=UPI0024A5A896|nr:endolytic transglycosylase MltG [Actinomadura sp. NBRC 104425]GLZ10911.1 ABC transporter substrate-binding protein [Actinomadura sp. NBRC 104425]
MNDLDLFSDPYGDSPRGHGGYDEAARRRQAPPPGGRRAARRRQRRKRRNSRAAVLFALAFLVAVGGTGGVLGLAWVDARLHPPDYEGSGTGSVTVQIKEGDSGSSIAAALQTHGVVKSARAFVKVYGKEPKAATIQPGFYQMRKRMSSAAAMALLLDPKSRASNQITIPEGLRATQVVQQLSRKTGIPQSEFTKVLRRPTGLGLPSYAKGNVEGYLWPGRYDLNPNASAEEILKQMVDRFKQAADRLDLENRAKSAEIPMSPGSVVIMASLIQAESGRDSDMPKISRVIYNRLQHEPEPMYLKLDSTTLYGLNKFGYVASSSDIRSQSPYNTYQHPGLPPGAISNPGESAIEAVFEPEPGDWLWFVATDPKNRITEYADTEAEFNRLRAKLNAYLQRNGGN